MKSAPAKEVQVDLGRVVYMWVRADTGTLPSVHLRFIGGEGGLSGDNRDLDCRELQSRVRGLPSKQAHLIKPKNPH